MVETNDADAEQVAVLAERLDTARERLAAHERRLRVYERTLATLEEAERATMKAAARFLEQRLSADIAQLTEGRYRAVQVDENELALRVWSDERGDWIDSSLLSQGTVDQLYLAARLGLARQVTHDRRPPLVLDDPFVTFDDDRARRAAEMLRTLTADHQVLYLTTSTRYDEIADKVIALPAPATPAEPAEPAEPQAA
jgi:uncharacterized protein YhaN